jgi:type IV pilus assembly protein PilB
MSGGKRIGELLVAAGLVSRTQADEALAEQARSGLRVQDILLARGFLSEAQITQVISNQLSVAWVSLDHVLFTRELLSLVPLEVCEQHNLIPAHFRRGEHREKILYVAMDDPTCVESMQRVSESTGMHVRPLIAPTTDIRKAIREQYYGEHAEV